MADSLSNSDPNVQRASMLDTTSISDPSTGWGLPASA